MTCTCGAEPPNDARFCHKCGRPLRDDPGLVEAVELPPPPRPVATAPPLLPPIGFHNALAVRIALLAAAVSTLLLQLTAPLAMFGAFAWLLAGGFFAVQRYRRRTGARVSPREGARLGWITGLFSFLFAAVLLTVNIAAAAASGDLATHFREQFRNRNVGGAAMEEALRFLETPGGLGFVLFSTFCVLFVVFACLPMLGGAIGAKVLEKEN